MKTLIRISLALVAVLTITACGSPGQSAKAVSASAVQNLGCKGSQSQMWDSLQRVAEEGQDYPSSQEIRQALEQAGSAKGLSTPAFAKYVDAFVDNYTATVEGVRQKFGPTNTAMWRRALAEMEVGIRITDVHAQLSDSISASLQKLASAEQALDATCTQPAAPPSDTGRNPAGELDPAQPAVDNAGSPPTTNFATVWDQLKANQPLEVYGARRVLATAYQSCDVLGLPPMSASSPAVVGVSKDSKPNPSNGGILRHYGNLANIDASHYYIHGMTLPKSSCQEVRNNPPIYDFGGKPYTTSTLATTLNMMRGDGGSGSEVFGVDCSGFIFSSLAAAGLRIIDPDPNKTLKATMVMAMPAAAFKEPQSNHMSCLAKISIGKTASIQSGDIVATKGHIIMLESIGADPFGLNKITSLAGCSGVSYKNFDFVIAQSSPSKGSIGINRIQAKYYLADSGTMRTGLEAYGAAACRAKFGAAASLSSPNLSVVRHKHTPECRVQEFALTGQSCVDSCHPL